MDLYRDNPSLIWFIDHNPKKHGIIVQFFASYSLTLKFCFNTIFPSRGIWVKCNNLDNLLETLVIMGYHPPFKIQVRGAAGRGYSYFHVYMCFCIYVCHASWPNEKRYRPEIWS